MMEDETLTRLQQNNQIAARYSKNGAKADGAFPYNPNGSMDDIAAITDESGRILAMMPHPERGMFTSQRDDYTRLKDHALRQGHSLPNETDGLLIFQNAASYFGINRLKKAG